MLVGLVIGGNRIWRITILWNASPRNLRTKTEKYKASCLLQRQLASGLRSFFEAKSATEPCNLPAFVIDNDTWKHRFAACSRKHPKQTLAHQNTGLFELRAALGDRCATNARIATIAARNTQPMALCNDWLCTSCTLQVTGEENAVMRTKIAPSF